LFSTPEIWKYRHNDNKENLHRTIKRENPELVPNGMETESYLVPPIFEMGAGGGFTTVPSHDIPYNKEYLEAMTDGWRNIVYTLKN